MQMDNRNMILAIVLSVIVLFGWQFFIAGPQLEQAQRRAQIEQFGPLGFRKFPLRNQPIDEQCQRFGRCLRNGGNLAEPVPRAGADVAFEWIEPYDGLYAIAGQIHFGERAGIRERVPPAGRRQGEPPERGSAL